MHRLAPAAVILPVMLAGCAAGPEGPEPPLDRPQTTATAESLEPCGGADLADAVGDRLVQGGAGAGELSVAALPENARIVYPGTPTDLSFRPDRLTVTLTGDGTIRQLTCG